MQASDIPKELLDRIHATPWHRFVHPPYNNPDDVPRALERAARGEHTRGFHLLDAVGNNHRGTYYPVLLAVLPFLEEILITCGASARSLVIGTLLDLWSFEAQAEFGKLESEVRARIQAMRPTLVTLAKEGNEQNDRQNDKQNKLAQELVDEIDQYAQELTHTPKSDANAPAYDVKRNVLSGQQHRKVPMPFSIRSVLASLIAFLGIGSAAAAGPAAVEQAVIVHFEYGAKDWAPFFAFEKNLEARVNASGLGEYDGNELAVSGADGYLYMYGPDADKLYAFAAPLLRSSPLIRNATVRLVYGKAGAENTPRKEVPLRP